MTTCYDCGNELSDGLCLACDWSEGSILFMCLDCGKPLMKNGNDEPLPCKECGSAKYSRWTIKFKDSDEDNNLIYLNSGDISLDCTWVDQDTFEKANCVKQEEKHNYQELAATQEKNKEAVDHPRHYKLEEFEAIDIIEEFEVIDIIEEFELGFNLGNAIKYILRAGKKNKDKYKEDLKKAVWYLNREVGK